MNDDKWTPYSEVPAVDDSMGMRMWVISGSHICASTDICIRGILGYGAIGRQCARVAKALGMDVVAYTLRERATPESRRDDGYREPGTGDPEGTIPSHWFYGSSKGDLNNFLSQDIDVLVVSLPLSNSTRKMISTEQFEILSKRKTFVSNIGRGELVDSDALVKALETGQIRGAAVDVTDPEPLTKGHPLWRAPNLLVTPHISWLSRGVLHRVFGLLKFNLAKIAEGKPVVNQISHKA